MTMLNEPKAEPLSQREVDMLNEKADALTVPLLGYVEQAGTMATTFAIEEWDGGITRVSIPSRIVLAAYERDRQDQGGSGE